MENTRKPVWSALRLLLCLTMLTASLVPIVEAPPITVDTNKVSYLRKQKVTVSVSGGTPNGIVMIQFEDPGDVVVWADQGSFDGAGDFNYQLEIPSAWSLGTYTVRAKDVQADQGSSITFTVTAPPPTPSLPPPSPNRNPNADAGPDQKAWVNRTVHFDGSKSTDSDGYIVDGGWTWSFGDGETASGKTVSHTYQEPGSYTVTLTAKDNRYGEDSDTCKVTISEPPKPVTNELQELVPGGETAHVVDVLEEANTRVTLNTTDPVTVTVLKYEDNPYPADPMPETALPNYVDVEVSDPDAVDWPIYVEMFYADEDVEGVDEDSLGIYYWKDGEWRRCSDTGVDTEENVVWAYMTAEEASGSPILVGGTLLLKPAEFEVASLSIEPEEVELGSAVRISVDVANVGEEAGSYGVTLSVEDGLIVSVREVTLQGGESEMVVFTVSPEAEGTYDVEVEGLSGSFHVTAPIPPPPLPPMLSDLTVTPEEVEVGGEVTIGFVATNVDERTFVYTATVQVGDATLTIDVELGGYEFVSVSHTVVPDVAGTYGVTVDGLTGSFEVKTPPKPAEFEVADLEIDPEEVEEGEEVTISLKVSNVGEEEGTHTVELRIDGSLRGLEAVTLPGGGSEEVSFEVTRGEGNYQVEADGLTGRFTVTAPLGPPLTPGYSYGIIILIVAAVVIIYLYIERNGPLHLPSAGAAQSQWRRERKMQRTDVGPLTPRRIPVRDSKTPGGGV